jgi:hypothetical protein
MINLRYHIVSLAAAFLAFGLGILAGTTVINSQLVESLEQNTTALRNDLDAVRGNVADLQKQLDVWERFGRSIEPALLQGRLAGRAVVILADRRVPNELIARVSEAFTFSNAKRPTRLTLTDKWSLSAPAAIEQLALALRIQRSRSDEVVGEAAARIGSRLAGSSDARADGDVLRNLEGAGFLDIADLPSTGPFPAANAIIVVVSSGAPDETPQPEDFFVPMLKVVSVSRIVAAAEPSTADRSRLLAELVRGDGDISRSVCTVDHVDTVAGLLSLVYGLRDLGAGKAATHYGVRGGSSAVAPDVRAA